MKLRPVTYNWDKDRLDAIMGIIDKSDYPEKYDIEKMKVSGFIAQEVEQAALETGYDFSGVSAPDDDSTPYSLSYGQFVVPLVKTVQELADRNDQLVEKVGGQQEMIDKQQDQIDLHQQQIKQQQKMIMKMMEKMD